MMAKLVGRIPADQVAVSSLWQLPEVNTETGTSKVFKLSSKVSSGKFDTAPAQKAEPGPTDAQSQASVDDLLAAAGVTDQADAESEQQAPLASMAPSPEQAENGSADADGKGAVQQDAEPTVEPIEEQSIEQAVAQAVADGKADGFKQGEAEGLKAGETKGYAAGEAAGKEQGRIAAEVAFEAEVATKKQLLQEMQAAMVAPPKDADDIEAALLALITQLSQVVILNEYQSSPELIARLVSSAIEAVPHGVSSVDVRVHPDNLAWLDNEIESLDTKINYVADKHLSIGSCQVVSERSRVDGTLSKRINDSLLQILGEARAPQIKESELLLQATAMSETTAMSSLITPDETNKHATEPEPNQDNLEHSAPSDPAIKNEQDPSQ